MNFFKTYISRPVTPLLLAVIVSSCADNGPIDAGRSLPAGKYPLSISATVDGMVSRSTEKSAWTEGDSIGVRIGDYPKTGLYMLHSDGSVMSAVEPLDWQTTDPTTVTAWYPYVSRTDVSIKDQSEGITPFDFLGAVVTDQVYTKKVNLDFKHKMAKVSYELVKSDGISDEDWSTVKASIRGFTKVSFSETILTGSDPDWITPSYENEALLVPQDMNGQDFIKINMTIDVNGNKIPKELIYKPGNGIADLQAGTHYRYVITVKKDRLEVQSLSASWTDDGGWDTAGPAVFHVKLPENVILPADMTFSKNVQSDGKYLLVKGNRFSISYEVTDDNMTKVFQIHTETGESDRDQVTRTITKNADDKFIYFFNYYLLSEEVTLEYVDFVQVGDYYYSNGTWGPLELKGSKTPIGVVFKGGPGSVSIEDKATDYGWKEEIHGYAVALKDAVEDMIIWGSNKNAAAGVFGSYDTIKYPIPYSGYNNTIKIKEWGEKGNAYDAAKAALDYEFKTKAPDNSSGWYLPTPQQLADIENLPDRAKLFTDVDGKDVTSGTIGKDVISYWSCLEVSAKNAWIWRFDAGDTKIQKTDKTKKLYVRAVLTF